MSLPTVMGEFRLVDDPLLKFTPSGKAVASIRLAASSRKKDEASGEWKDDKQCFLRGTVWDKTGEYVAESLRKGDLVEVRGALETRNYETSDGEKRTSLEVNIWSIAASLKYAEVTIKKAERLSQSADDGRWEAPAPSSQPDQPPF